MSTATPVSPGAEIEAAARGEWNHSAELRAEFGIFDTYLAYRQNQDSAQIYARTSSPDTRPREDRPEADSIDAKSESIRGETEWLRDRQLRENYSGNQEAFLASVRGLGLTRALGRKPTPLRMAKTPPSPARVAAPPRAASGSSQASADQLTIRVPGILFAAMKTPGDVNLNFSREMVEQALAGNGTLALPAEAAKAAADAIAVSMGHKRVTQRYSKGQPCPCIGCKGELQLVGANRKSGGQSVSYNCFYCGITTRPQFEPDSES